MIFNSNYLDLNWSAIIFLILLKVAAMLDDVLSPREKEDLPALGSRGEFTFSYATCTG